MAWPWQRKHDPVEQEVADQHALSEQVLVRVELILASAAEPLRVERDAAAVDAYMQAEDERQGR